MNENKEKATDKDLCPQCVAKYTSADIIYLNPSSEVEEKLRFEMQQRLSTEAQAKANSKKKMMKEFSAEEQKDKENSEENRDGNNKKKKSLEKPNTRPHMHPSMAAASRAITTSLAMEEAKRKAEMSEAVRSIYQEKEDGKGKETFMTNGTFTRYA